MQVPALFAAMLAENPVRLTARIGRDVVVAADFQPIPPAGLDALGAGDEREGVLRGELAGTVEKPCRAYRKRPWIPAFAGMTHVDRLAIFLGSVIVADADAEHTIVSEPRAETLDEALAAD